MSERRSWWRRLVHRQFHGNATEQVEQIRALAVGARAPETVQVSGLSIARAICDEAKRGCDVIVLGSGEGPSIGGPVVEQVVGEAPCHVAIMKAPRPGADYRRILVPVDGSIASGPTVSVLDDPGRAPRELWAELWSSARGVRG